MTLVLRLYRHCRGLFPGWSDFLALLDNNIGIRMPFIQMGSISNLQHHVPNRTGFVRQSHFWLDSLRSPLASHITVIHILSGRTFSFLSLIPTCHHIFFNRRHRGFHLPDFLHNYVIQALAPVIHYRYSLDKYNNVPYLVYFNLSY